MSSPRVWVDVVTPKQVLFFSPVINELREKGCEVLVTSREHREVAPMAKMCGLKLKFVGRRGGMDLAEQLVASTERQLAIIPTVNSFKPSIAVSVASVVCARVAYGLKVKHVAVNDSPHSEVAGRLSLPLTQRLICPWIIPSDAWEKFGLPRSRVEHYRALDPAVWLKRPPLSGPIPRLRAGKKTIVVRLEESYAPYMAEAEKRLTGITLKMLADEFLDTNLVALCRYGNQLEEVEREYGSAYTVPTEVVDGRRLLESTDLFIGMGGTMTAEAALMGVPTISAFQGVLLTELYLRSKGLIVKTKDPNRVIRHAHRLLSGESKQWIRARAKRVLDSMEDPVPRIATSIMNTAVQAA